MKKQKLTLSIDDELIFLAHTHKMNISKFLELKLAEYFKLKHKKSCWESEDLCMI